MMLELNKIYNMDCIKGMKQLPDNFVDCVILDPPYNSGSVSKTDKGRYKKEKYLIEFDEMSSRAFLIFFKERLTELWRVTKIGGHCYCFSDWKSLRDMCDTIELSSWRLNKILVWDKINFGTGRPYRSQVEFIIFGSKSNPSVGNILNHPDIFRYKRTRNIVPYSKPIELVKDIIKISTKEMDVVLDCFMGSGTTAVACKKFNRRFIGFEVNKDYCKIANKRLEQEYIN